MTTDILIAKAARALRQAKDEATPCAPVRHILETESDLDLAYAVQTHNVNRDVSNGRRIVGRKIGLTNKVVQQMFAVHQPDFGALFSDMCIPDGVDLPSRSLFQPRAEAEVALVLGKDLDQGNLSVTEVISAIEYALPAIEVVDSRIKDWDMSIVDTIADNASSGLFVVGTTPVPLSALDLVNLPMRMEINGSEVSTGSGAGCLGNPLWAAVWLANELCRRGTPLRAGECLLTGALGPMVPMTGGDEIVADMGPLGRVSTKAPTDVLAAGGGGTDNPDKANG